MIFPTTKFEELFDSSKPLEGIFSVWGDFGVGKTTFALQTAFNTAKFKKNVVYIYSKPSFPIEKVKLLFNEENNEISEETNLNSLDNVIFIQTTDLNDLNTIVFNFEFMILNNLKEKENILNLIIIDSLTDLYRIELDREKKEVNVNLNYQLSQILANLFYINETYSIEVLVVNELSLKTKEGETIEIESGGKVMGYWAKYSLKISHTEILNERKISLTKHPENKKLEFSSKLTNNGFI